MDDEIERLRADLAEARAKIERLQRLVDAEELRPVLYNFARHMERQLRANDHKPGWQNDTPEALMARLRQETDELANVVAGRGGGTVKEAADVANFAMMVADVFTTGRLAKVLVLGLLA